MRTEYFKPDFAVLDGIRGIAALYVVINHARGHLLIGGSELAAIKPIPDWTIFQKLYYSILQFTALGSEFVIVFFVLSGFSIAYSLRNGQHIGSFYLKRLIRLYPPYLWALFWAFLVFIIIKNTVPELNKAGYSVFHSWESILYNLIYVHNGKFIPQFWSLIHEVFFYLLIPFALIRKKIYYSISLLLFIVGLFITTDFNNSNLFIKFLFSYNFYFFIGVYLYFNYKNIKRFFIIKNNILFYSVITLLFLITILINYFINNNKITFLIASFASVLLVCNFLEKKITNRFIKWVGEMSYTLYISHFASIYLFYALLAKLGIVAPVGKIQIWWVWPIAVVVALFFSKIFYIIIEKRTKLLLDKIRKNNAK